MGFSACCFCGQNNGDLDFTDGVYLWPQGLARYILKHGIRLPEEFVEHVRRREEMRGDLTVDNSWWQRAALPGGTSRAR